MTKKDHRQKSDRTLTVRCPDCSTSLEIDAATGAIVHHQRASKRHGAGDFDQLVAKVADDRKRADAMFDQECAAHEDRHRLLNDRYDEALSRINEVDDTTPAKSPFDFE